MPHIDRVADDVYRAKTKIIREKKVRTAHFPHHPTYWDLLHPQYKSFYVDRPFLPRLPGIHLVSLLQDLNLSHPKPVQYPYLTVLP